MDEEAIKLLKETRKFLERQCSCQPGTCAVADLRLEYDKFFEKYNAFKKGSTTDGDVESSRDS